MCSRASVIRPRVMAVSLKPVLFLVLRNDSRPSAGLLKDCKNCNLKPNLRFVKVAIYL